MIKNERVLVISDQHFPYSHPDTINFLRTINAEYQPDRVINIGDELDFHSISFHDHDPELLAPSDELKLAISKIEPLYDVFPVMDLIESNHGSLVYRKGKHHGLPRHVFKSYRDVLGAPRSWHWDLNLTLTLSNGQDCFFHHGLSRAVIKASQNKAMNLCQGHFHSKFEITYWGNSVGLFWGMTVGCLIDDKSLAYAYNRTNLERPIIGTGIIINGHPRLIPMILNSSGRWIKRLV